VLILIDAHRRWPGHKDGGIRRHRVARFEIVEVDDDCAMCRCQATQQGCLTDRPRALKGQYRLVGQSSLSDVRNLPADKAP